MIVGLTGASGFVGRNFSKAAAAVGHQVVAYSHRTPTKPGEAPALRRAGTGGLMDFSGLDALVHLAGEPIFGMWTPRKKQKIRESRVSLTRTLVTSLAGIDRRPSVLVSASAIGYYGDSGDQILTEESGPGDGFLSEVTQGWESSAAEAGELGIRVVRLRFGIILGPDGGALTVLRRLFQCCMGGRLGNGRQWMSWIQIDDAVGLIMHALADRDLHGAVNAVAPTPVTNDEFTHALAQSLGKPAFLPVPAGLIRLLPGGQSHMFLDSQRVYPGKALESGYLFKYPTIADALTHCFPRRGR